MNVLLDILLIVLPAVFGVYVFFLNIPTTPKILVWIICLIFSVFGVYRVIQEQREKKREARERQYQTQLLEEQKLRDLGRPQLYINGLGKSPLLKDSFNRGQEYEKKNQFQKAINEYNKCLFHPNSTEANKVAAHILIGNCYYRLSNLGEAKKHYQNALSLSKKVADKVEKLRGRSVGLGNIGIIYSDKGELDKALNSFQDALKIAKEIGDRRGEATDLGNIGLIYRAKGELDKALKSLQDALKIAKEIGVRQGEASALNNIGLIYSDKGELDKALKYHQDSLKIHKEIGDRQGEASVLNNIGIIYSDKGELDKALKSLQDALFIVTKYNLMYEKEIIEKTIKEIEA
jgi:tetratricopeptide (TPR) repeat protein